MCGIQVAIARGAQPGAAVLEGDVWAGLTAANRRRGPDAHGQTAVSLPGVDVYIRAHVLHLRGPQVQPQPLAADDTGDVLCWNGEVFGGIAVGPQNDGARLLAELQREKARAPDGYVLRVIRAIEGPYALVYLDRAQRCLWYARDYLGRRSLLTRALDPHTLLISSVAGDDSGDWAEVPAQKVFCLDLASGGTAEHSWRYPDGDGEGGGSSLVLPFGLVNQGTTAGDAAPGGPDPSMDLMADWWRPFVRQLEEELTAAIRTRTESIPSSEVRVGVLFSGGVDCMVIAALLTRVLPRGEPIELLNVAFENPRQARLHGTQACDAPDRKTGLDGWRELRQVDPGREWRFVEVDVPHAQAAEHAAHIRRLLAPAATAMDMSIGMAVWFAARGQGRLAGPGGAPYAGRARVLLLGMGADEQLGGYSRHRAAWDRGGWPALAREIDLDTRRIASRNLGRDDRVISDCAREARFPFLAANVVRFLSAAPLDRKVDMRRPRGVGEKLLLRLLARSLGLARASTLPKRAIQFGARTAKMDSGRTRGQDAL